MPPQPYLARRRALALLLVTSGALGGCGTSPPVQLYRLPSAPPLPVAARPTPAADVWQLLLPVRIPDYLDREALLLPQGDTGLLPLSSQRWAESLRDAVPRVLRADLAALRGEDRVWISPLPAGVAVTRRLRVELLAFETGADRHSVHLQARWSLADTRGREAPRSGHADLSVGAVSARIEDLVAAHRLALWRLAERIAAAP